MQAHVPGPLTLGDAPARGGPITRALAGLTGRGRFRVRSLAVTLMLGALIPVAAGAATAAAAQPRPGQKAILEYASPTSATWGPSPAAPPTFAFGKPAQVLLVVPGGYVVRQELPLEEAMVHATYVSQQLGQPVTVTIPDPAGGAPRVESIGRSSGDVGK